MTDTDLEQRLGAALVRASEDAPSADGLAARVAARRRRSRRTAIVGVGAVLAVAVAVVAVAVAPRLLTGSGGSSSPPQTHTPAAQVWRTVTVESALTGGNQLEIEIPADWQRLDGSDCSSFARVAFGEPDADPCARSRVVSLSILLQIDGVPGALSRRNRLWGGYVNTSGVTVLVAETDRSVVRRVLASVRPAGEPAPDLSVWRRVQRTDEYQGSGGAITAELPESSGVEVRLERGLPDCARSRSAAVPDENGTWTAGLCRDRFVSVRAPTQSLADVVAASVRGY